MENKVARFDLTLLLEESEQGLSGLLEYNSCLFDDTSIEQMIENYQVLLEALVADPDQCIWDLPLISVQPEPVESETLRPLVDTQANLELQQGHAVQKRPTLYERFALQARRTPFALALVYGSEQLSYQELYERANRLAEQLQEQGMVPGTPVGLALERSQDQVIGLLAVLKGEGICVPLEEEELRDALIDEAGVRIVLTRKALAAPFQQRGLLCLCLEEDTLIFPSLQVVLPMSGRTPSRFEHSTDSVKVRDAFMFLSCSEGLAAKRSVGVYQDYEQIGAFLDYALQQGWGNRLTAGSVWSLLSSAYFAYELFLPLVTGGTAHLVPEELRLTGLAYSTWLAEQQITSAYVPALLLPTLLRSVCEGQLLLLRMLLTQAEAYPEQSLVELQTHLPDVQIFNGYGSPEIGMWKTLYALRPTPAPRRITPIGCPYENDRVLLLDRRLHPVPRGVIGELYVVRSEATRSSDAGSNAERFLANPFDPAGDLLYRTGAWARLLPDGNLELIGLEEQFLEVHGLQVWPAESAALLAAQPGVHQAVTLVREREEGKRELVAYVVPEPGREASLLQADLERLLKEQLPISCVPSVLIILKQLPLTRHGQLNVSALPQAESTPLSQSSQEKTPITPLERDLMAIWLKILKLENVSVQDNFFDRGGHSLLLIRLHNEIQSSLKLEISILDLFKHPTIHALATFIQHEQQQERNTQEERVELQKQNIEKEAQQIDRRTEKQKEALMRQKALMKEKRKNHGTE